MSIVLATILQTICIWYRLRLPPHFRASAGQLQVGHLSLPGHQQGVGAGGPGDHHDYGVVGRFAYLKHKRPF